MRVMEFVKLNTDPKVSPKAVVQGKYYRISVLTAGLIRFEYSKSGIFEDRATQSVINRNFPVPEFQAEETDAGIRIRTEKLEIRYDGNKFSPEGLSVKMGNGHLWHYGEEPRDLRGTTRTLDGADGAVPLGHGLISREGFSVLYDRSPVVLLSNGWVGRREAPEEDFYFWGYGHRYQECLKDFYRLCGPTPLLPRFVFGNWWSRYHRYSGEEYKNLVRRFEKEKIPFSVAVIDMDWHRVDDVPAEYGSGWTGYTWNRKLFPDPREFLEWLHRHGLKVTLNVHPADGIRAYEEAYPRIAEKMGIDPKTKEPVPFDVTDPHFMKVYFNDLCHPMEREGVDFWWLDWQQGTSTKIPGLDPLWMLNHYYYLDSRWKGTRALTFSRYAGIGSHRYPIGFSGDTIISWNSLKFQPYFTANASNIGYGWWSHDIGGHMKGTRDDELMARWIQLGVFSPINRLHSTNNPFSGKEPWNFNPTVEQVMIRYLRLRHALIPYLYTMNRIASYEGQPLIRPMYYLEPDREEAYHVPNNYYFGTQLMVSPITEKSDPKACVGKALTWIPEGTWYDFFRGRRYRGGFLRNLWRPIEEIPVLAKSGAVIPLKDMSEYDNSTQNPVSLEVRVYPGKKGSFILWEDDGKKAEVRPEDWASTHLSLKTEEGNTVFSVGSARGNTAVLPKTRNWKICFYGVENADPSVSLGGEHLPAETDYCRKSHCIRVTLRSVPVEKDLSIVFRGPLKEAVPDRKAEAYEILLRSQISNDLKVAVYRVVCEKGSGAVATLEAMGLPEAIFGALCEILTA